MNLTNIFNQVFVLFLLILVGFFARKKDLLDENSTSKISTLIVNIFLPSMIISSMQIKYSPDMANNIIKLLIISAIMYFISFIFAILIKFIFKKDSSVGVYQYVILFSNVGFMGYPVVEAILGKSAVFYTAIFNLPFNLLLVTLGSYLLAKDNEDYSFSLKSLFTPVLFSVAIGLLIFTFSISLPQFLNKTLDMLGSVTTPLSMLIIGSLLSTSSAKECFGNKKLYFISFIRLIVLPFFIYIIFKNVIYNHILFCIPVIISAMPAAANTAIMASEYGSDESLASQAVFLTTLFSIITIPLISIFLLN